MNVLALETSCLPGSIAYLRDDEVLHFELLPRQTRTTQVFAAALQRTLRQVAVAPEEVSLFAVSQGPGSFTGLRIGVTAAKVFSYAVGCEVLGVSTLDLIAYQSPRTGNKLHAVIDAQRDQLFVGTYRPTELRWTPEKPPRIVDLDAWLGELADGDCVSGPGLKRCVNRLPSGVEPCNSSVWTPRADALGALAYADYQAGRRSDPYSLLPQYYRRSAAEENLSQGRA